MSKDQKSSCCDSMKDGNSGCAAFIKKMKAQGFDCAKMMKACCGDKSDDGSSSCYDPSNSGKCC